MILYEYFRLFILIKDFHFRFSRNKQHTADLVVCVDRNSELPHHQPSGQGDVKEVQHWTVKEQNWISYPYLQCISSWKIISSCAVQVKKLSSLPRHLISQRKNLGVNLNNLKFVCFCILCLRTRLMGLIRGEQATLPAWMMMVTLQSWSLREEERKGKREKKGTFKCGGEGGKW